MDIARSRSVAVRSDLSDPTVPVTPLRIIVWTVIFSSALLFSLAPRSLNAAEAPARTTQTEALAETVVQVVAGKHHTCVLLSGGGVKCWGRNNSGQVGDGTKVTRQLPVDVVGLSSGVKFIAAGDLHTCALTTAGAVKCWGENIHGQIGDGTLNERTTPANVNGLASGVTTIDLGWRHSCAALSSGVKCWGSNQRGGLGDGTTTNRTTPVSVQNLATPVAELALGYEHTCALTTSGAVRCWGGNTVGQLGDGTTTDRPSPVTPSGLGSAVDDITAEFNTSCARAGGALKCWGSNSSGQIGDGTTTNRSTPVTVSGLGSNVAAISTLGDEYNCALLTDGGVQCWGLNTDGQIGDGTTTTRRTPVDVQNLGSGVAATGVGDFHACALKVDGALQCWGQNTYGQIGDNTTTNRRTPTTVQGLPAITPGAFNCSTVSQIPQSECEALKALRGSTGAWNSDTGWLSTATPCSWYGVTCTNGHVTELRLAANGLDGQLPDALSGLTELTVLEVQSNDLSGPIPASLGQMSELVLLSLWKNGFTGSIPPELGNLSNLDELGLGENELTGTIPPELGNLSNLTALGVHRNQLTGEIPPQLGNLSKLEILNADVNMLSGNIPSSLGNLTNLRRLWIERNQFEGPLPSELGNLVNLENLSVHNTKVGGEIPTSLTALTKLTVLRIGYNTLSTENAQLATFLDNLAAGWADTQTVSPDDFSANEVQETSVKLAWTPISYTGNGGHYEIQYGQSAGGPYPDKVTTADKTRSSIWVSNLSAGTTYYFVIRSHTPAHDNQQNDLYSPISTELSVKTLDSQTEPTGCHLLQLSKEGQGDEITASPANSSGCSSGKYLAGEVISLLASPATNWRLGSWSGTDDDSRVTNANQITMPDADHSVVVFYEGLPLVALAEAAQTVSEGAGSLLLRVRLSQSTSAPVTVDYATANGTATSGLDYEGASGSLTFAPGTVERTVQVTLLDDNDDEANETFSATISNVQGGLLGAPSQTSITISDDDGAGSGDGYEADNTCAAASLVATDGSIQRHTFHAQADTDWVRFDAVAGQTYLVNVSVPPDSPADVAAELYLECDGLPDSGQDFSFSPGVRIDFTASRTGSVFLKLVNNEPGTAGDDVAFELSVRSLADTSTPGALIILAGSIRDGDPVQPNIYNVADSVYQLFLDHGYTDERIYYLAPNLSHSNRVDALATVSNLRGAITQWAGDIIDEGEERAVTIYIVDHGTPEVIYLDKRRQEWISPDELDAMLDELEADKPNLKINVIIEACYSGSFISQPSSISKPGRVVVASADDLNLAWTSPDGAQFSDHFIAALRRGQSVYHSFQEAKIAAEAAHPSQVAWLDGDGDASALDDGSLTAAAQRGFSFAGTLSQATWPPFIAEIESPIEVVDGRATIRARVVDDVAVRSVRAVVYPPDYKPPTQGEEMAREETEALQTLILLDQGKDWYAATYPGFDDPGSYRVVVYAEDNLSMEARPYSFEIEVDDGNSTPIGGETEIFLPLVVR